MNQEQVKNILLTLEDSKEFFSLIFTGKASKKVNGFYIPSEKSIYIHNKNMSTDNQLIYTAIHEYAHHIQNCSSPLPISSRCHTKEFYSIFYRLLNKATERGIYKNDFASYPKLEALTNEIRERFLKANGELMIEFGKKLLEARALCAEYNLNFKDYANRILSLDLPNVKSIISVSNSNLNPAIGYESMKKIAALPYEKQQAALNAALEGMPPQVISNDFSASANKKENSLYDLLIKEKNRIEKSISNLNQKLTEINRRIEIESIK